MHIAIFWQMTSRYIIKYNHTKDFHKFLDENTAQILLSKLPEIEQEQTGKKKSSGKVKTSSVSVRDMINI